ncbi:PH domain-containing protein [Bacillus sp. SCS-153A]|uniref:PH domain-containing protein n=1 Tax=Rossellomorea sedimentorum TaxID=3115294 RepID=UPI003905EEE5
MSEKKRLHPISAVANFLKQLKELILPFIFLVFLNSGDDTEGFLEWLPFILGGAIMVFLLAAGITKWLRFSYWLEEGELRMEHGLFVKKKRYIPFERIQSLNLTEGILQRPFGLVKVKVETAGSTDQKQAEAELTAISKHEAQELQRIITEAKSSRKIMGEEAEQPEVQTGSATVFKMNFKHLLLMATTSGGAGVVISGVFIFLSQFDELIPYQRVFNELEQFVRSGIVLVSAVVIMGLLIAWIAAIIGTLLVYADFTVKKQGDDLVIARGLLEKKQVTVPMNRIQGVRIVENILREPLGYAAVEIESAGGSVLEKESSTIKILPLIKKQNIPVVMKEILPEYKISVDFQMVPKRSMKRYLFRESVLVTAIVLGVSIAFWPLGLWSLFLYIPFWLLGYLKFRSAGWNIASAQLGLRYRSWQKHTLFMKKHRIQALETEQNFFQVKRKLANVTATVKSGETGAAGRIIDLDDESVRSIYRWYRPERQG